MGKTTKKGETTLRYINKYNNSGVSKRALANILVTEHPDLYRSVEDARKSIRSYTYSAGNRSSKLGVDWNIPEGDESGYTDFHMPFSSNNLLILSDIHFPFHSKNKLEKALNAGLKNECNAILLNGDSLDCNKISKYEKHKDFKDMFEEVEYFKVFISELKKNFDVPIYFKIGNHEERWERLLKEQPQFHAFEEFQLKSILKFGENNITEITSKQEIRCGEFSIWHGHEFMGGGGVDPAKWLFDSTLRSGACGHFHRIKEHKAFNGTKWIRNYSIGTLGELRPRFMPHQKSRMTWENGFGILQWDKQNFEFQNFTI